MPAILGILFCWLPQLRRFSPARPSRHSIALAPHQAALSFDKVRKDSGGAKPDKAVLREQLPEDGLTQTDIPAPLHHCDPPGWQSGREWRASDMNSDLLLPLASESLPRDQIHQCSPQLVQHLIGVQHRGETGWQPWNKFPQPPFSFQRADKCMPVLPKRPELSPPPAANSRWRRRIYPCLDRRRRPLAEHQVHRVRGVERAPDIVSTVPVDLIVDRLWQSEGHCARKIEAPPPSSATQARQSDRKLKPVPQLIEDR